MNDIDEQLHDVKRICIESRLEALEQNYVPMWKKIKALEESMNKVVLENHNLKNMLGELHEEVESKQPYKCPVCKGKYIAMFKECESACLACDKGIVWG